MTDVSKYNQLDIAAVRRSLGEASSPNAPGQGPSTRGWSTQRPITAPARADRPVIATPHRSPPADAPLATGVRTTPLLESGARKW